MKHQQQVNKIQNMVSDLVLYARVNGFKIGAKGFNPPETRFLGDDDFKATCVNILKLLEEDARHD